MIVKEYGYSLQHLNTFGIDVTADRFVSFDDSADLPILWEEGWLKRPLLILGQGANILFCRKFEGTIIHPNNDYVSFVDDEDGRHTTVRAGAGMPWDNLVAHTVAHGLCGLENLSGIPASVGGAVVQNIGAYGAEISDFVESVDVFDTVGGQFYTLKAEDMRFVYRGSALKNPRNRLLVSDVKLRLPRLAPDSSSNLSYAGLRRHFEGRGISDPTPAQVREAVLAIRAEKLPDPAVKPNAGSFFKNPVVEKEIADSIRAEYPDMPWWPVEDDTHVKLSGGWLIEKAGWKGRSLGPAAVDAHSALVLVNLGGAEGSDILRLAYRISVDVRSRFCVNLQREVIVI